jgi:hypothetical protein
LLAIPTAFFAFRLQGAYFAIGTWVIAEVVRLLGDAQWKAVGGGTGTSLPRAATRDLSSGPSKSSSACATPAARDILSYWLAVFSRRHHRRHLLAAADQTRPGSGGGARQHRSSEIRWRRCRPHEMGGVSGVRLRHRPRRRADLSAEGAHLTGRGLLAFRTGRPT